MAESKIVPEKITKPIQLLAAWLAGLVVINGSFLLTASHVSSPSWAAGALIISAIVNVPLFLLSIFLLQTRFRPEMQEDSYYSQYLEKRYSESRVSLRRVDPDRELQVVAKDIATRLGTPTEDKVKPIESILKQSQLDQVVERLGSQRTLSELYLATEYWPAIVERWKEDVEFQNEMEALLREGVVAIESHDYQTLTLTQFGRDVAKLAASEGKLFKQLNEKFWRANHLKNQTPGPLRAQRKRPDT